MEKVVINNKKEFFNNKVYIDDRTAINVTGVNKVISSNEKSIVLETVNGKLHIDGENLQIDKLNVEEGSFTAVGVINGAKYLGKSEGVFKRLFK